MARNIFNSVSFRKPKKSGFDLSHDVKFSLDMGNLTPIMVQECVPGDKFSISGESMIRFSPLISPVMHRMDVSMHYFFVPNRLLWKSWEDWITGNESIAFPYVSVKKEHTGNKSLAAYLGIPEIPQGQTRVSALPFAAYQMIYNEYYRDQNLVPEVDYKLYDGSNTARLGNVFNVMRKRAWQHDYFTAALPFAQKGGAVEVPLISQFEDVQVKRYPGSGPADEFSQWNDTASKTVKVGNELPSDGSKLVEEGLYAKTSELGGQNSTINDLRRAFRLQEWLERNARGGTRYVENILAHFGVRSSDKRMQRPEYITGIKAPVVISEVLNTAGVNSDDSPVQGNMAGHGISVANGKFGKYFCEEHGYIIGIMSVMPKPAYQQGLPKHFLKFDRFDYFWPEFSNIGEQEVLNKELCTTGRERDNEVFGYVPRYAEYKYTPSRVAGDFRGNLDFWHLGRIFDINNPPSLNQQFIEVDGTSESMKRIFAVTDGSENNLYAHVVNKVFAVRPMPKYGNPSF